MRAPWGWVQPHGSRREPEPQCVLSCWLPLQTLYCFRASFSSQSAGTAAFQAILKPSPS